MSESTSSPLYQLLYKEGFRIRMYKLKNVETYDSLLDFLRDELELTEGPENNVNTIKNHKYGKGQYSYTLIHIS